MLSCDKTMWKCYFLKIQPDSLFFMLEFSLFTGNISIAPSETSSKEQPQDLQVASHYSLTDGPGGTRQSLLTYLKGDLQLVAASLLDHDHLPPAAGLGIRTFSRPLTHKILGRSLGPCDNPLLEQDSGELLSLQTRDTIKGSS